MTRCKTLLLGLSACLLLIQTASAQFSSNIFFNGHYKNAIDSKSADSQHSNSISNIFLEHPIISRQAQPFSGPQYLPPKEYLTCKSGQVCVRKSTCQGGYFTNNYGGSIQNCDPITDTCCTYRPPPTTPAPTTTPRPTTTRRPTTTTTTPKPYITCGTDTDCVSPRNCRNGEITIADYVKSSSSNRCYAPEVCCRLPSTVLTPDGYVFNVPQKNFPLPTNPPRPQTTTPRPTYAPFTQPPRPIPTRPNNGYLPPSENEIPSRPQPTPYRPEPTVYRPQSTPYHPEPTVYRPQSTPYRPEPTPYRPQPIPQPSNQVPVAMRGEDQLSPQIFPTPAPRARLPSQPSQPLQPFTFSPIKIRPAKCAAALVCTDVNFCNSIGVISETRVSLTPGQAAFRVPLTDCVIAESGAPGKCCRDSNYVDPWPVNLNGYCAQRNKNTKPQGVKDLDANFAEIPWQAMILKESTKTLLCGGTIIGSDIILTAASCVDGQPKEDIRVKAGEWQLGSDNEPMPFQLVTASEINIHPEYNPSSNDHNLAMIKLERPLQFATHIGPLCISDAEPSSTEQCVTSGWGKPALKIHEQGAIMHQTPASAVARSECGANSNEVCASTKFDACAFDIGSALACGSGSNVVLKGIYSSERQCGENEVVKFAKLDIKWINTAFTQRNRPLLLQQ